MKTPQSHHTAAAALISLIVMLGAYAGLFPEAFKVPFAILMGVSVGATALLSLAEGF